MMPILFAMPGNEEFALHLNRAISAELGQMEMRRFPDGESYIRLLSAVAGREVIFVCTLHEPDANIVSLYLAASIARELGACRIGVVAPYLAYMRQDACFKQGEGITSAHFARFISGFCDWLVTVDPHLHRHQSLDEIYSIPTKVVRAAPAIAQWILENVERPVIIGPDAESEQWVEKVAKEVGCSYHVLEKIRSGDRDVVVSSPECLDLKDCTPVLVDDIASTARTMISAVSKLRADGLGAPVSICVHPVFVERAFDDLQAEGVSRIISCNTITHPSNAINIADLVGVAVGELLYAHVSARRLTVA